MGATREATIARQLAKSEKPPIHLFVDFNKGESKQGMKTSILTLTAALVLTGGTWLHEHLP
jgi:hypothetical protein